MGETIPSCSQTSISSLNFRANPRSIFFPIVKEGSGSQAQGSSKKIIRELNYPPDLERRPFWISVYLTPSTLHPPPCFLQPTPYALFPVPCTHFFHLVPTWVTPVRVNINQTFFSAGAPET